MPKFVSSSSGHVYAHDKIIKTKKDYEDAITNLIKPAGSDEPAKKPSAINKKGTKEKQKNSLDLFKEELKRLQAERDEQRNKVKKNIKSVTDVHNTNITKPSPYNNKTPPVPVPLKPDPRCSTSLTLQVNLNPKDRESSICGSFDNGDPTTTNIYLGNINPTVNENDLCNIFGKYGPLASIKIMWPRTEEEKARNRNSGFVAYMSRLDAERAFKALDGQYIMGWGKAIPIPRDPVYIPPQLLSLMLPPPRSGLPFNAQLHQDDLERNYVVPSQLPKISSSNSSGEARAREDYNNFIRVLSRATVRVVIPRERKTLDRIHKTIEYVLREGPVFEAIIIAREGKNPDFAFLYDNQSCEHIYYRWKLYSLLHGDDPYHWRTDDFRMFEGGSIWRPPPLNPYAAGMPEELIDMKDKPLEPMPKNINQGKPTTHGRTMDLNTSEKSRFKGSLGETKRELLGEILQNLDPTTVKIGGAMMFCIDNSDAAQEIIDAIYESLLLPETPFHKKIARIFLVSDILHNCSAAVTNTSFYRKGFQSKLVPLFEHLRDYLNNIEDKHKADKFKQKVLAVLGAWKEWTLFEDEFILQLSEILLGIKHKGTSCDKSEPNDSQAIDEELDGVELDDETLGACLESKGLSLRWYRTLELSEDEESQDVDVAKARSLSRKQTDSNEKLSYNLSENSDQKANTGVRFKTSKWETVDPSEVAEQVVTLSKWEMQDEEPVSTSDDEPPEEADTSRVKRLKSGIKDGRRSTDSSSRSSG